MEFSVNITLLIGSLLSIMLSVIAWFIRQLHHDFKCMQKEVSSLSHTAHLIQAESKSANELIKLKISFLEWRMEGYGSPKNSLTKQEKNENNS
ncbi:hypothetical protein [Pedobacter alpinus]|uniref:Phage shock protein B n=1 Tax=Pedobacter alpinus TaxID=1590643 RepID=A0ABW5TTH6_9SPHI